MTEFDPEEKDILGSFEKGEWRSVVQLEAERERIEGYAKATFRKDRNISIRISAKDLEALQKRAVEEGIPYLTLAASILHKFVSGRLEERKS
jgi:predicted DNA binding CopG/RHH family protein